MNSSKGPSIGSSITAFVAVSVLVAALTGVASTSASDQDLPSIQPVRSEGVRLTPGDVVAFKFFYVPELNDEQAVRPDGKIALQLVGEVQAEGKTPEELRQKLYELYTPQLKKPDVTIIVRSFQGRRVYVGGEVNTPGAISMPGPISALEAIMQAGGFNHRSASVKNVVVIRHQDGKRLGAKLDFRDALKGREFEQFSLEPLDIVYVPRTAIVKVDQWIDQHINKIVPTLGLRYDKAVADGTLIFDATRRPSSAN